MNTCRFCHKPEFGQNIADKLIRYGKRHWAHHGCFLDAGKSLDDLSADVVGRFPFRVLKDRGLLKRAEEIVAADKVRSDVARINAGRSI